MNDTELLKKAGMYVEKRKIDDNWFFILLLIGTFGITVFFLIIIMFGVL